MMYSVEAGPLRPPVGGDLEAVARLLGGQPVLRRRLRSAMDAHELIADGLPGEALTYFVSHLTILRDFTRLEGPMGMSFRTYQRRKEAPARPLSPEQGGRTWKFAEILAKAMTVFGSQEEAEQWLERPAIGLDQRRPIGLLTTPAGVALVEDYLQRLEYGVYT